MTSSNQSDPLTSKDMHVSRTCRLKSNLARAESRRLPLLPRVHSCTPCCPIAVAMIPVWAAITPRSYLQLQGYMLLHVGVYSIAVESSCNINVTLNSSNVVLQSHMHVQSYRHLAVFLCKTSFILYAYPSTGLEKRNEILLKEVILSGVECGEPARPDTLRYDHPSY